MFYSVKNWLASRDNTSTTTTELDRIKEIANRIRLFDQSVSGEVLKFAIPPIRLEVQQKIALFC